MHSEIASDDDNVAINEASRGVYVEFLVLHHGKGINFGSLGEAGMNDPIVTSVHFRDVLVDHCRYEACITTFKGSKGKTLTQFVEKYPEKESYFGLSDEIMKFTFPEPGPKEAVKSRSTVVLRMTTVTFHYPTKDKSMIVDVTLTVSQVSRVAVVGASDAGKSTAVKVLAAEQNPTDGAVWKAADLRIAYIAQHAFHHLEKHVQETPTEYITWRVGGEVVFAELGIHKAALSTGQPGIYVGAIATSSFFAMCSPLAISSFLTLFSRLAISSCLATSLSLIGFSTTTGQPGSYTSGLGNSVLILGHRVRGSLEFAEEMKAGRAPKNGATRREMKSICQALETAHPEALRQEFCADARLNQGGQGQREGQLPATLVQ